MTRTAPYPARRADAKAHIGRHFLSFRDYVKALKGIGQIQEIDQPVDWNLEMGAIIRHSTETKAAVPLFNNVIGADPASPRVAHSPHFPASEPTYAMPAPPLSTRRSSSTAT